MRGPARIYPCTAPLGFTRARDFIIRKAATHGQATFASESFGRGTDFFCKDSKLTNAGAPPAATGAWPFLRCSFRQENKLCAAYPIAK